MEAAVRFVQAFLLLSLGITLAKLSVDTGGGDYFFTLVGLVLLGTVLPYLLGLAAMRKAGPMWAGPIGAATAIFGAIDTAVRMQAFFFPTDSSDGGMALWLPIYAVGLIPAVAVAARTLVRATTHES